MNNDDYNNFIELMKKLSKNFTGNITDSTIRFYFSQLKKYKLDSIKRGINYLINKRPYHTFPIIGEITNAIKESKYYNDKI